ncbi:MoxR family ATPase [Bacteriovoracaceae bacterium]|nr:MoxR family ATPase [Bacteriovoracaceae bacterium]
MNQSNYALEYFSQITEKIDNQLFFGNKHLINYAMMAYALRGHLLIEGPPGTGKTLLAKLLAKVIGQNFSRIQFTADLLPADIIGSSIYLPKDQEFKFIPGPLFSTIILADEINRTPPRTQSALLEAMEERQVTIEGKTYKLSNNFTVIATQNSLDFEGTFPLPEAQLDRFLFRVVIKHANIEDEVKILKNVLNPNYKNKIKELTPVKFNEELFNQQLNSINIDDSLYQYIAKIILNIRKSPMITYAPSVRASLSLIKGAKVIALLNSRDYVIPDDIIKLIPVTLSHRLKLNPEALMNSMTKEAFLDQVIKQVEFPQ